MIMPAYTTLPESMLAPSQIADKFNVQTFAGLGALGCDCSQTDDGGDCLDPDPCSTGSTDTGTGPTATCDPLTGACTSNSTGTPVVPPFVDLTSLTPSAGNCASQGLTYNPSANACSYGSVTIPAGANLSNTCASFGLSLNPSTGLCVGSAAAAPSSSAGSGLTSAQQAQLSAGLLKGGLTLAELLAIQPGQAILPNGTIVSGNTGALAAGSLASLGASMTSMLPLLLIGGIALMLFTRK